MTRYAMMGLAVALAMPNWAVAARPETDPLQNSVPAWSPYLVGSLIGLLSMTTLYFSEKPLGASTAYARLAGMFGNLFNRRQTESLKYCQENEPALGWEVMLLFGTSFLTSVLLV